VVVINTNKIFPGGGGGGGESRWNQNGTGLSRCTVSDAGAIRNIDAQDHSNAAQNSLQWPLPNL